MSTATLTNMKPTLLCIDSAQGIASLGLVHHGQVLAERQLANKRDHAERFIDEIQALLDQAELKLSQCTALVVGLGPGSFIGVRIGLATVKGLAFGANLPIVGVCSSAALALSAQQSGKIAVAVDAKKGQVYASAYVIKDNKIQQQLLSPQPLAPAHAMEQFSTSGPFNVVIGDGFDRYADVFAPMLQADTPPTKAPSGIHALALAQLAQAQIESETYSDLDSLAPHYARRSEAEIKRAQHLAETQN